MARTARREHRLEDVFSRFERSSDDVPDNVIHVDFSKPSGVPLWSALTPLLSHSSDFLDSEALPRGEWRSLDGQVEVARWSGWRSLDGQGGGR